MKKSFMTRALAMGLSLAMAFSLSAATNVSVASAAATPAMASKQFAVRVGGAAKSYKASTATQKSFKITKATVGNTDKATVKVNSSKKSIKVTPGTVTGTTVVKVTFKNIKTAKTTAKKYRCVVKAAIEDKEPEKPEVVKATKITEAKASTAKTVSVTFDGVVDTTSATSIKLMRGSTEATVTAAYASDAKSLTLTSATPLAAGTYTLTVGSFEPVSFNVAKQTPTKLQITSTTVANTKKAGVGFQVLDQYGEPMSDYTAKKLVVTAYNATKGHKIQEYVDISKPYFQLDCPTQDATMVNGVSVINALGDKVSVVAYLKDNASVSTTAELTITNIYMESLEFGEPELGKEKRVTVNKTYKLPYTAKTNEGNNATFAKVGKKASTVSRPFGDYTFVTSNISALDMGNIEVDKDGNMFFTAGGTAGTAVITAINTKTGTTVSTTIVVNDVPTLSRLDVADASIAWNAADNTEVKAAVTAYDQFDEVIDAKDIKNIKFDTTGSNGTTQIANVFSTVTRVPNDAYSKIAVDRFSNDGKYLIYKKTGNLKVGQNITFNFTSAKAGANGYITFKSIVEVNDRIEPGALTIVTEPDATKQEGQTVKVQFSVLDQYQNKVDLVPSGSVLKYHADKQDAVSATDYLVEAERKGAVASVKSVSIVDGTDDKVGQFEFNLASISELYEDGEITLKLTEGGDQIDAKKFAVKVVDTISKYDVSTDKTSYKAGDTVTVTVNAYSNVGSLKFNRHYNGKHDVEVILNSSVDGDIAKSKTRKTIEFKDGVATFTMTAGTATDASANEKYKYKVTQIGGSATTYADFFAAADGFTVATNSSNKISVDKALDKLRIVDSQGNKITAGTGTSYATVVVKDETLGKDITGDSKIVSNSTEIKLNDKTAEVILAADKVIDKIAGVDYNLSTGFSIDAPATSANSNISISITVDGCTWKGVEKADANGDVAIKDAGAVEAAAVAEIKAFLDDMTNATAMAASGTAVEITVTPGALTVTGDSIIKAITGSAVQVATSVAFSSYPVYDTNKITATTKTDGGNAENDDYTFTIEFEIGANDTNGVLVVRKADVKVSYKFTGANVVAKVESATLKN